MRRMEGSAIGAAIVALGLAALGAAAESERDALRATMRQIFESVRAVLPLTVDEAALGAEANRARVHPALQVLARQGDALVAHARTHDPGFGFVASQLASDSREILRGYEARRFDQTAFLVRQLTEYCVACHTRLPSPGDFPLAEDFVSGTTLAALPTEQRAVLETATRRFDDALASYEALFVSTAAHPAQLLGDLTDYLVVAVRVKGDLARPLPVLRRFAARPDLWRHLRLDVERWIAALEELRSVDLARGDLGRAKSILEEARRAVAFPSDRAVLVHYVVASSLLYRFVEAHAGAGGTDLAEAYYLLGLVESRIGRDAWVSPSAAFLESAIRTAPHSRFAEQAYALLEEEAILGYAGGDGIPLPPDVEGKLAELRGLIDAP